MENLAKKTKKYNYEELEKLRSKTDKRYELVNGELYLMSSPRGIHQMILLEIGRQLSEFFEGKKCKPFIAPFDVVFAKGNDKSKWDTVLQPDIFVLCDLDKYEGNHVKGAPNFIIEIASPSNLVHDRFKKYSIYQRNKVKEYWIIEPNDKKIFTFLYSEEEEIYSVGKEYNITDDIPVASFKGLKISLADFYNKNKEWVVKEEEEEKEYEYRKTNKFDNTNK